MSNFIQLTESSKIRYFVKLLQNLTSSYQVMSQFLINFIVEDTPTSTHRGKQATMTMMMSMMIITLMVITTMNTHDDDDDDNDEEEESEI